ncbi:MAG TPA: YbaB/EbfC family nucleoid-associated protein [Actinophytocola sp.]|jgi:DNA-binding protein YbaB|uniref:YbaB/EbfC family nucleoid-associated protein n=1 Tax=Actinophytocola sp. TaxID=1872138 RepID=UPI002F958FB1
MSAEFEQLLAEFESFQSKLQNVDSRFENIAGMQGDLAALEVSVSSPDRAVTVVAGVGGSIQDIRFTETAMQLGSQRLGAVVMATMREAVAEAARKQAVIVQEYAGGDAPVLEQVLETQSQVTGQPVEELRKRVEQETAARPPAQVGEAEESIVFRDTPARPPAAPGGDSAADSFLKSVWDEEDR